LNTSDPAVLSTFYTILIENASRWAAEGWSGHIFGGASYSATSGFILATPLLSLDEANTSMQSVFNNLSTSLGSNATLNATVENYGNFYDFYEDLLLPGGQLVGVATAFGGRLVPASQFEGTENQVALRDALLSVKAMVTYPTRNTTDSSVVKYGAPFVILVVSPTNYPVSAANDTSSITPAWRESLWNIVANLPFSNQASVDEIQRAYQGAHEATELLRSVMPDSGAYSNEADLFETDYSTAFWGEENYERLLSIKTEIDPGNILTCWHCVGYNPDDEKYGCYPSLD
jgi:FAD/FMN-containing dehydrogenase